MVRGIFGWSSKRNKDDFRISGPYELTHIDWGNRVHKRCIAASLVKGVYVFERDRQKNRSPGLAPPWWEFFNFKLVNFLVDDNDGSYFGAIFEFQSNRYFPNSMGYPPKYVIAFRGTIFRVKTMFQDLKLDSSIIFNELDRMPRFTRAMEAVERTAAYVGGEPPNMWLAGHSLGSAIALLAGRNMVLDKGICLQTYLFNPPFTSLPIEQIKNPYLKNGVRFLTSFIKFGCLILVDGHHYCGRPEPDGPFAKLSCWEPHMFVNSSDIICAEAIRHFENWEMMYNIGAGGIQRCVAEFSAISLFIRARGENSRALHLLPSAWLTINSNPSMKSNILRKFKEAHQIDQWWRPDSYLEPKLYKIQ